MFIGVNSGTAPRQIADYARRVGIPWPIIADTTRALETKAGIPPISLQNIKQAAYITADGQLMRGSWSDVKSTIDRALVGASWKVDPSKIPSSLRGAWKAIEFGSYALGAKDITKSLKTSDDQRKQGAQALFAVVEKDLKEEAAAAWELGKQKDYYGAYAAMSEIQTKYNGYPIPVKVTTTLAWLKKQDSVKTELQAQKILTEAKQLLIAPRESSRNRAVKQLNNIANRFPETRAAREAKKLIDGTPR